MEEMFENKLLDDLFEIRGDGLECAIVKKYGECEDAQKALKAEEKLTKLLKETIQDDNVLIKVLEALNDFEGYRIEEMCFWDKQYYKLGFVDGFYIKKEIRENKIEFPSRKNNINEDTFFNNCYDDFIDYFERKKSENLFIRDDYKELTKKMQEIKNKFPRTRDFIEDEEINELTKEEMKALSEIIQINGQLEVLEIEEAFKTGIKEAGML